VSYWWFLQRAGLERLGGGVGRKRTRVGEREVDGDSFTLFPRPPLRGARADGEGGGRDSPGLCRG
jgi:hypothetical protein